MIDRQQAISIAETFVAQRSEEYVVPPDRSPNDGLVIVHEHTIEKPYGWIFFYISKRWLETRNFRFAIAGNAPLLVKRETAEIQVFGTAHPIDWYIERYEQGLS